MARQTRRIRNVFFRMFCLDVLRFIVLSVKFCEEEKTHCATFDWHVVGTLYTRLSINQAVLKAAT